MDLSVIIPNYNTKDLVFSCVNSIKNNPPKLSYEIIVIDNGSNDGSAEFLSKEFKNSIIIISNRNNYGFSKACNQGLTRSSGKFKLLLNSDTEVQPNSLDILVQFAMNTKDAGVVGSRLLNKDKTIQPSCFLLPTIARTFQQFWLGKKGILDKYYPKGDNPAVVEALVGASFLITPKAIETVGYLDERYFMFYEDLDYCRRVKKQGLKVYYVPSSHVVHYHGESGKKLADNNNQWRRLIPSSKIYHGIINHSVITLLIWSRTKINLILGKELA